jgi:hypothetical protein
MAVAGEMPILTSSDQDLPHAPPARAAWRTWAHAACTALVAAYVTMAVLPRVWHETEHHDFGQFYMGGVMARQRDWANLYPQPYPEADVNPGWRYGSVPKPAYDAAAAAHGVPNTFRYIQLPTNAIAYVPLSYLSYQNAYRTWHVVMLAFLVISAWQAGRIYAAVGGPRWWGAGVVTLLVGCSPLMVYTARVSNTGPLLAACVGATVLGLLRPERTGWAGPAVGIVVGGYTKFAPGVILPVAIAMRRWRTVGITVGAGLAIGALTVAITGLKVWQEFFVVLWPPLQKSSDSEACQSLYGFMCRVLRQFPLERPGEIVVAVWRDLVIACLLALLVRRRSFWDKPAHVAAASAAVMAWLLAFAPVAWQFYHCMLAPLWGWLAWEFARGRRAMRVAVVAAIAMTYVPSPGSWWGRLPEPIASRQLFSALLILTIATWRLRPAWANLPTSGSFRLSAGDAGV